MTLTEFLTARLAEDEAAAKACESEPNPAAGWHLIVQGTALAVTLMSDDDGHVVIASAGRMGDEEAAHIGRWDPARVLREVEAKRRILAETFTLIESEWGDNVGTSRWGLQLLGYLALPYSDHPDYDPAWGGDA